MNYKSLKLAVLIGFEYLKRNKLWIVLGLVFIVGLIFAQAKFNFFHPPNQISLGFIGTYQEHNLPIEATKLVSEGLVKVGEGNRIEPNLITGWDTNNDATIFSFKLKDNLKWADGSDIKSTDLEFSIPDIEVSTPNDKTIQFHLKEPYSPFPSLLTKPIFKKGSLIGIGPYKISKIEKSVIFITKMTLVPPSSLKDKLPTVYIRFYPNEKVALTGFSLGEVQSISGFSSIKFFLGNPSIAIKQKTDFSKIVTILFQTKDPLLSNRSIRQALGFATPQIEGEEVANNPYPPTLWAYNSDSKKYLSNESEAKLALERAKSQIPDDKLHSELILTSTPNLEEVGNKIVSAWKGLGFDAKLRIESGIPQNFQALLITQSIPIDPDQYFLWHTTQAKTNLTKYDSKRVDKDLEDGRKIIAEDDRKIKYFDFQKTLLEDAPATFLYFPKYNVVYLKKVGSLLSKVLENNQH